MRTIPIDNLIAQMSFGIYHATSIERYRDIRNTKRILPGNQVEHKNFPQSRLSNCHELGGIASLDVISAAIAAFKVDLQEHNVGHFSANLDSDFRRFMYARDILNNFWNREGDLQLTKDDAYIYAFFAQSIALNLRDAAKEADAKLDG